jgi:hypothetical protein
MDILTEMGAGDISVQMAPHCLLNVLRCENP